mgnify:CR=1 FL=1
MKSGIESQQNHKELSKLKDTKDPFLITWIGNDDPELPTNWSTLKKCSTVGQVIFCSWVSYTASSIYFPSTKKIEEHFNASHIVAALNLSLFILGYGVGPLILSPLYEAAVIGRQPYKYLVTFHLYFLTNWLCHIQ